MSANMTRLLKASPMRGTTLLEVLMVIALLAFFSTFIAFAGLDSYGRALAGDDIDRIESLLRNARAEAQGGVCRARQCSEGVWQGLILTPSAITPIETTGPGQRPFPSDGGPVSLSNSISFAPEILYFAPYSGRSDTPRTLTATTSTGAVWEFSITEVGLISSSLYLP